jgi:Mg2+ and Co2+ transporter CorA
VVEDPSAISEIVLSRDRLLWLDLEQPTTEDFALIQEEFGLHPLAIEDAMSRHQRPKVDQYENFYLVIFYTVDFQEPGAAPIPGRRGLSGASFLRSDTLTLNPIGVDTESEGDGEDEVVPTPVVELEGETNGDANTERIVLNELTLFLGENFLITVHENPIHELDEAARRWTQNVRAMASNHTQGKVPGTRTLRPGEEASLNSHAPGMLDASEVADVTDRSADVSAAEALEDVEEGKTNGQTRDVGVLLYSLLDTIVDEYFPVIDSLVERMELIEQQIFERFNQNAIEAIFTLKKDLLALRRVLAPERDVLNILTRRDLPIFDKTTAVYFQDVYDHVVRVTDSIDSYRELLSSALDGFLSMQSHRLNITVQTLTSFSIILMSIATLTGWYGMNFENMPEIKSTFGYPILIAVVAVVVTLEALFFKRKGWL